MPLGSTVLVVMVVRYEDDSGSCSLSLQTLQEEGEAVEGEEFPMAELAAIIGQHNAVHCPPLIHLALADSAYSVLTTPPDSKDHVDGEGVEVEVEVEG